jgi:hypothetical protein
LECCGNEKIGQKFVIRAKCSFLIPCKFAGIVRKSGEETGIRPIVESMEDHIEKILGIYFSIE